MLLLVDYWLVVGWNLSILWTFGNQDSSNWFICGAHRVQLASLANRRVNHVRGWCCSSCLRFFLGCLPLWWLLDPAEGDCCGLLLDPLCHLALLLSVASLTHVLFQYCAISSLGRDFPILFLCSWGAQRKHLIYLPDSSLSIIPLQVEASCSCSSCSQPSQWSLLSCLQQTSCSCGFVPCTTRVGKIISPPDLMFWYLAGFIYWGL